MEKKKFYIAPSAKILRLNVNQDILDNTFGNKSAAAGGGGGSSEGGGEVGEDDFGAKEDNWATSRSVWDE